MILEAAVAGALAVSARWNWWRPRARGLPVLMYHKVGAPPEGSRLKKLWVSEGQFRRQLAYLGRHGRRPMTLRGVARELEAGRPAEDAVVITFDDGYRNNLDAAFPILREFGYPATLFVVAGAVGRENVWHDPRTETRIPMLDWPELRALQDAGWEIGSHTLTHPRLTRISREDARREIEESRRLLGERLGEPPVSFAHPYGDGADDPEIRALIAAAGYRWACSVHQGLADPAASPLSLRRLFVRGDDTAWDFHLNLTRGRARF